MPVLEDNKYIEDSNGNTIDIGEYRLGATSDTNPAAPQPKDQDANFKYLKDNISNKFYPITLKSLIVGGIGRGSSREVTDFTTYINDRYSGVFKLVTMGNHVKYFTFDITKKVGSLNRGDNILSSAIPVTYYPEKDLVFRSSIEPDSTSRVTIYLSSTDGRLHCHIIPLSEVLLDPAVDLNPILSANHITGFATFIQ